MANTPTLENRFVGSLLGLAVGDALGGHFEGQEADWLARRFPSPDDFLQTLPRPPWHYTDDTQMAIGLTEALLADRRVVEESLCKAFASNYVSSRGYGRGARYILEAMREERDHKHLANELFPGGSFGNGAAMRVAPIGLLFREDHDRLWEEARLSSLPTHVHPLGIEGAQLVALAVALATGGKPLDHTEFFNALRRRAQTKEFQSRLAIAADVRAHGDLRQLGNGIAAQDSAVTAIACFSLWPDSYEQVIAHAILLGGDTDTIAAMAGAVSGAYLGTEAIPNRFLQHLEDDHKGRSYINKIAVELARLDPA